MELAVGQLINGLSLGSILLLLAFGLNVTFGMMGVINFAHGEFMMMGAYATYLFQLLTIKRLGDASYFLSIPVAFAVVAGFGLVVERTMIRRLYGNAFGSILATWGLSLIIMQLLRVCFGYNNVQIVSPGIFSTGIPLSESLQIPLARLFIFLLSAAVVTAMCALLYNTRVGKSMQAVMQNRDMAGCLGIDTQKIDALTFSLGSGIAGVAGAAITLLGAVGPEAGQNYIVDCFMVVCLGGIGGVGGTVAGAVVMGLANPYIEYLTSASMGKVLLFALIIAFLHFRPAGLIPRRTRALEG
jgi:urea transport system permease protein